MTSNYSFAERLGEESPSASWISVATSPHSGLSKNDPTGISSRLTLLLRLLAFVASNFNNTLEQQPPLICVPRYRSHILAYSLGPTRLSPPSSASSSSRSYPCSLPNDHMLARTFGFVDFTVLVSSQILSSARLLILTPYLSKNLIQESWAPHGTLLLPTFI